jgi:hypothetical protein
LTSKTREPVPPAFFVPLGRDAESVIRGAPDGDSGEEIVKKWADLDFSSCHGGLGVRFEEEARVLSDDLRDVESMLRSHRQQRDETPSTLEKSTIVIKFPPGLQGAWLVFLLLALSLYTGLEWYNAACFGATFETGKIFAALAFTLVLAVAPMALKMVDSEPSPWKRLAFRFLLCVLLFGFVHVFSDTFIQANVNATSDQIVGDSDQSANLVPALSLRFWEDPLNTHWRFMWQTALFTVVGLAVSNYVARKLVVITTSVEIANRKCKRIERTTAKLTARRQILSQRLVLAESNLQEFRASKERHVLLLSSLFREEMEDRKKVQDCKLFIDQREQLHRRTSRLSENNHNNH